MELSIFLATVIGWYFVIVSLFLIFRLKVVLTIMEEIMSQRGLLFFMGLFTLILGLLLVVSHNIWVMGWPVVITIIAWLVLIGGIMRLAFPALSVRIGQWWLNKPAYLIVAALIYLIIGICLLYFARVPF